MSKITEATTDAGTRKKPVSYIKWSCRMYRRIFYQNLKLNWFERKLKDKEINGYNRFGKCTETDRLPNWIMKYQARGTEATNGTSEVVYTVNRIRTGHKA